MSEVVGAKRRLGYPVTGMRFMPAVNRRGVPL